MAQVTLLVEWDEASALRLAEAIWDAGGRVRIIEETEPEEEPA